MVLDDMKISFVKDVSDVLKLSLGIEINNNLKSRKHPHPAVAAERN